MDWYNVFITFCKIFINVFFYVIKFSFAKVWKVLRLKLNIFLFEYILLWLNLYWWKDLFKKCRRLDSFFRGGFHYAFFVIIVELFQSFFTIIFPRPDKALITPWRSMHNVHFGNERVIFILFFNKKYVEITTRPVQFITKCPFECLRKFRQLF